MERTMQARQARRARSRWTKKTRTTLIAGLRRGDQKVAMPTLCQSYWAPLFDFISSRGCGPVDAHDVTQSFFVKMMKPGFFEGFDPARGRFRNWLRTAAKRCYLNWIREGKHELVGADPTTVGEQLERAGDTTSDADRAFDRALTGVVVRRALERLRRRYADEGQDDLFSQVHLAVLGERRMTDDAATSKLVGKSISVLKKVKYVAKQTWMLRYKGCLREELAALGVRRTSMEDVIAELLDASR